MRKSSLRSPFHDNQEGHKFRYTATQPGSLSHCWEREPLWKVAGLTVDFASVRKNFNVSSH